MIKINYINQYDQLHTYKKTIVKAIKTGAKVMNLKGRNIINVVLVNNDQIHEMNKNYREIDRPTDVLSFENTDDLFELGDIFISIDKTKEQATDYLHSFERELAFLSVHGFLHCLGYDHLTKTDEDEMTSLQKQILDKANFKR